MTGITTPTAPRWINLDELVSQETRAMFAAFAERLDTCGPKAGDKEYVQVLYNAFNNETSSNDLPDGFISLVADWTGWTGVEAACERAGLTIPE